jgi:hypothetical protein
LLTCALVAWSAPAFADAFHGTRANWQVGAGWAWGRGKFEAPGGSEQDYRDGASAQIRLGYRLGRFVMVGADYQGWSIEFGELSDTQPDKFRRVVQSVTASVTLFPGKPETVLGGFYLKGGAGYGWAGTGAREVEIGTEQGHGERVDEFGTGYFTELGYEFFVSDHFTIGAGAAWNYFDIGGDQFVDKAWFGAGIVNFNLYFGGS